MPRVKQGENDLYTWCLNNGDYGRQLASEYTGIDTEGKFHHPTQIAAQSNKRLIWKCKNGHQWEAVVQKRTILGSKCPYCIGNTLVEGSNDLYTWCIENNRRDLINEFTGKDEDGKVIDIHRVTRASNKKVEWKHIINGEVHTWIARISDRTSKNSKCPICNGKNIVKSGKNDLLTWCKENIEFGQILMNQWTGIREDGKVVEMSKVSRGSSKTKLIWMCDCGKFWSATPLHRIYHRSTVCPDCTKKISSKKRIAEYINQNKENSLKYWCKTNGFWGDQLEKQFLGIDEQGNKISLYAITFSSKQKVWWHHYTKQGEHHKWVAMVCGRTRNKSKCSYCNTKGTSLNEQIIYRALKQICTDTLSRQKYNGYEFDISIPSRNLYIEYNGSFFHIGREARDEEKIQLAKRNNWNFVQIIASRDTPDLKLSKHKIELNELKTNICNIIEYIKSEYSITGDIDYKLAIKEATEYMMNY